MNNSKASAMFMFEYSVITLDLLKNVPVNTSLGLYYHRSEK